MNRIIALIMSFVMIVLCVGCSEQGNNKESKNTETSKTTVFDKDVVKSQIKVTEYEYPQTTSEDWIIWVLENTSEFNVNVTSFMSFYDAEGTQVDQSAFESNNLHSGEKTMVYFIPDASYETRGSSISVSQGDDESNLAPYMTHEIIEENGKQYISVTNTSHKTAETVRAYVVYMKDGVPTYFEVYFLDDEDGEVKANGTVKEEIFEQWSMAHDEPLVYDTIEVYFYEVDVAD
ncbi:MAG: hypothetical protein IJ316_02215 [Clostridia bacterium]|nr:hypothetical protein [Clostridia bacterium]